MKVLLRLCVLALLIAVPFSAMAQEDEEKKLGFVYATYFECDVAREWMADAIVENLFAPVYNAAVDDGTITAWGWMAHHTGGHWRRILYRVTPTLEEALDAQEAISEKVQAAGEKIAGELGAVCNRHEDYIWEQVAGSKAEERGAAGFSVYLDCDSTQEDRVDELMKTVIGPVYDKYIGDGKLTSWGSARHIVGGEWRRLATMSATDHKTLLKVRGDIIAEMTGDNAPAGVKEYFELCADHVDYMWDIQIEKP